MVAFRRIASIAYVNNRISELSQEIPCFNAWFTTWAFDRPRCGQRSIVILRAKVFEADRVRITERAKPAPKTLARADEAEMKSGRGRREGSTDPIVEERRNWVAREWRDSNKTAGAAEIAKKLGFRRRDVCNDLRVIRSSYEANQTRRVGHKSR